MASSRFSQSPHVGVSNSDNHNHSHFDDCASSSSSSYALDDGDFGSRRRDSEASSTAAAAAASGGYGNAAATSMAYLPQTVVLCELRHDAFEASEPAGPAVNGLVSKWRPKERVRDFYIIIVSLLVIVCLDLNIF